MSHHYDIDMSEDYISRVKLSLSLSPLLLYFSDGI